MFLISSKLIFFLLLEKRKRLFAKNIRWVSRNAYNDMKINRHTYIEQNILEKHS